MSKVILAFKPVAVSWADCICIDGSEDLQKEIYAARVAAAARARFATLTPIVTEVARAVGIAIGGPSNSVRGAHAGALAMQSLAEPPPPQAAPTPRIPTFDLDMHMVRHRGFLRQQAAETARVEEMARLKAREEFAAARAPNDLSYLGAPIRLPVEQRNLPPKTEQLLGGSVAGAANDPQQVPIAQQNGSHQRMLPDEQQREVRKLWSTTKTSHRALGDKFGVSRTTIAKYVKGVTKFDPHAPAKRNEPPDPLLSVLRHR